MSDRIPLEWLPREIPLEPTCVLAKSAAAERLLSRLRQCSAGELALLRACQGQDVKDLLVILGPSQSLPWQDGVTYLGREPNVHDVFVPTTLQPSLPLALVAQAVRSRAVHPGPWALLPEKEALIIVALGPAREIDGEALGARAVGPSPS